jgi:hypothetical protein
MEHDAHQNKVLALGIALLVSTALIVFSMHDADANPDLGRTLRVRDATTSESAAIASRAESSTLPLRAEDKRALLNDHR